MMLLSLMLLGMAVWEKDATEKAAETGVSVAFTDN